MSLALQVVLTGLGAGGVYGLVAIGHTLIYRLTGIVNFALGDVIGLGVFATLFVAAGTGAVAQRSVAAPRFLVAIAVGLAVCAVASAGSYAYAVAPYVARGWTLGWVAATVAVAFAIRTTLDAVFSRSAYVFPDPLPFRRIGREGFVTLAGASVQVRTFYVIAVSLVVAAVATLTLERTRFGRGLQAVAADVEGARVVGIPVERYVALAFAAAGGIAALAAVAAAPSAPFDVGAGTLLGLKGLVAALLVRFSSPVRAFVAGLGVGVLEAAAAGLVVAGYQLGPQYRDVVPLALALLLLLARKPRFAELVE
ncbi:MAG TPA: branched-chain amino acid ABC transporter permease [Gaiellaceae bacterium]